jgi:hypothetical protein
MSIFAQSIGTNDHAKQHQTPAMSGANGIELWRGASLIDGAPIVLIATGLSRSSANRKTGGMVQTYIVRADMEPIAAVFSGADVSICGDCPHRGIAGKHRTCYVNVGQGPLAVYRAWRRGAYQLGEPSDLAGRIVRFGTYGDPAALPAHVWLQLARYSSGHTGYTHQWRRCPDLRPVLMASCDTTADAREAQAQGWRTFRVALPCDAPKLEREAICPASAEAGKKLTCDACLACGGADGRRGSIVIAAHGGFAVMANVARRSDARMFADRVNYQFNA